MKFLSYLGLIVLVLSSCSTKLQYFTEDLYDEYEWTDNELKKIQFYVSQDVVLYRGASANDTKIQKGRIRVESDRKVEELIIKKGTPGVFIQSPKEDRFAISFDDGRGNFLMFGPNKKANGRFVLLAKDWDRRSGKITYGGELYETSSESAYAALMVDIKRARKTKTKTTTAGGKRVR